MLFLAFHMSCPNFASFPFILSPVISVWYFFQCQFQNTVICFQNMFFASELSMPDRYIMIASLVSFCALSRKSARGFFVSPVTLQNILSARSTSFSFEAFKVYHQITIYFAKLLSLLIGKAYLKPISAPFLTSFSWSLSQPRIYNRCNTYIHFSFQHVLRVCRNPMVYSSHFPCLHG